MGESECASLASPTRYVPYTNNRLMYTNHIVFLTGYRSVLGASPNFNQQDNEEAMFSLLCCWLKFSMRRRGSDLSVVLLMYFSMRRGGVDLLVTLLMYFSMWQGGVDLSVTSLILFLMRQGGTTSPLRY